MKKKKCECGHCDCKQRMMDEILQLKFLPQTEQIKLRIQKLQQRL